MTLDELKAKHGSVFTITVPCSDDDDAELLTIHLKKPDRTTHVLMNKFQSVDYTKAIEVVLRNLYVGGDELNKVIENDYALLACDNPVFQLMLVRQGELKKN